LELHLCKETGYWIGIKAPEVALDSCNTCVMGKTPPYSRSEQATGSTDEKIATPTGRIEDTYAREVLIERIATCIEHPFNQQGGGRVVTTLLAFSCR
jgi:hypothetical protein